MPEDERRPGLRARTVQDLARDLMLTRDTAPGTEVQESLDIGEKPGRRGRAIFLVGAGCSASAKIPLAADVAQTCVKILARRYSPPKQDPRSFERPIDALKALIKAGKVPPRYLLPNEQGDWGALYPYLFSKHLKNPNHQREVIAGVIGDQEFTLNWAHACLGALVQRRYVHTVLTTNFDQLVLQGIIATGIAPVVADGLESLMRISPSPTRPQIVHLHGSMHTYDLRNSPAALSETGDSKNLQATMLSLLRQSTVLVVVGYAGGEEGVMKLLQYAAENIPRMVVYWVAYERSYLELSPRVRELLEAGENKFFILDQDADAFFQRLMRALGEGQPDWIVDPVESLVRQGKNLHFGTDREIGELVDDHKKRVNHAARNKLREDGVLISALQARCEGNFGGAIKLLEPIFGRNRRARTLYAQSLQDMFDNNPDEVGGHIDLAIEQFGTLLSTARGPARIHAAVSLIEALFDKHGTRPDNALSQEGRATLERIKKVIASARKQTPAPEPKKIWLLDFYEARAIQELADKEESGAPDRSVVEAYQRVVESHTPASSEKMLEARDGLAQALVSLTDGRLSLQGTRSSADIEQMRRDLSKAIEIHTGLAEFQWHNSLSPSFAGALENLASDFDVLARLPDGTEAASTALRHSAEALSRAVAACRLDGEIDRAAELETKLDDIRERLR